MPEHTHVRAYFTPQIDEQILNRITEGESLSRICGPDRAPEMPNRVSVHRRIREDQAFRLAYLLARQAQATTLADEVIEIADGLSTQSGRDPNVGRDWLRVHARQWLAGVMAPRTYGKRALLVEDEIATLKVKVAKLEYDEEDEDEEGLEAWMELLEDLASERTGVLGVVVDEGET